jgi:hypothetical protein
MMGSPVRFRRWLDKSMTSRSNRQVREPEPAGLGIRVMTSAAQRDQRPPRRPVSSRVMIAAGLGVLLVAATIVVARADLWERPGTVGSRPGQDGQAAARPLPGVPLRGASGLRLLVANDPAPLRPVQQSFSAIRRRSLRPSPDL